MRTLVSKKKRRFKLAGFDLDLTYILPNVGTALWQGGGLGRSDPANAMSVAAFAHCAAARR